MNELYKNEIYNFVHSVLSDIETPEPIFKEDNRELTDYGKLVAKLIIPDIVKFAVVSSLYGNNDIEYDNKNGLIKYNYESLRKESLASIKQDTPELEARNLIYEIKKGMNTSLINIHKKELEEVLTNRLKNTSSNNLKLAQAIVDETGAGLNWRFDAAKDIADNNQLYNGNNSYDNILDESIDFWKNFVSNIKDQNPSVYTIGEVTDLYHFLYGDYTGLEESDADGRNKNSGRFSDHVTAQRMFIEDTGMTTLTNYDYMYGALPKLLSVVAENGKTDDYGNMNAFNDDLNRFLSSGPLSMVNYSHVATGNHDKPRVMHAMALDMNIFLFDTKDNHSDNDISNFRDTIVYVLNNDSDSARSLDYTRYSSSAIAVGAKLREHLWPSGEFAFDSSYEKYLNDSLCDIVQGKYIGHSKSDLKRANAFGHDDI